MLTTAIPADIWLARPGVIVHPGPWGDRGSSSLDWAIMGGAGRWGVTVLQANVCGRRALPLGELYPPVLGVSCRALASGGARIRHSAAVYAPR